MHITLSLTDKPSIHLPFECYASTPAINPANPYEATGVLHNAIFDYVAKELTAERYYGSDPCLDSVIRATLNVVKDSHLWELGCVCVIAEGCPCRDFIDWILANFPSAPTESSGISRKDIPLQRPSRAEIEKVVLNHIPDCDRNSFLAPFNELFDSIDRLSADEGSISVFQKAIVGIEASILNAHIAPLPRQILLTTTSVARHSLFLALSNGRETAAIPEWVASDAAGASIGVVIGGPKGGLIGATIFSLATVVGVPGW